MSGMVIVLLGDLGDAVDELHRLREVVELERPLDVFLVEVPLGELLQPVLDVVGFEQVGHGVSVGFRFGCRSPSTRLARFKRNLRLRCVHENIALAALSDGG